MRYITEGERFIVRRIVENAIVYTQDNYEFNIYVLDSQSTDFLYQLSIYETDDYHIGCEIGDLVTANKQQVLIHKDNLFYPCFLLFMNDVTEIVIQDDLGYSRFGKQVTITKLQDEIELLFEYEKQQCLNEFGIHIINVAYDGRSLIDQQGKDTKERLANLCDELFNTFDQYEPNYDGPVLKKTKS